MATINTFPGSPFQRALAARVQANVPVGVIGEPGQGKTASMESATSGWGRVVETVIGSNREATNFLGVMIEDEGEIKYSSFQWVQNLNRAEKGLLLLDEFNSSAPSTMKGMLRIVQERYVGDTKLNDSVSIVALMNPVETAVDAYDLPGPDGQPHDAPEMGFRHHQLARKRSPGSPPLTCTTRPKSSTVPSW